jgi:hypothetical protein
MILSIYTTMREIKFEYRRLHWCVLAALIFVFSAPSFAAAAPGDVVNCTAPMNISDSPGYTSADPLVLGDPAGGAHLFWSERVQGQPNASPDVPDTLMYSYYDGQTWSTPVDLFLSPRNVFNRQISSPKGILDEQGTIHLVWTGPDYRLYYSSALAAAAGSAHGWRRQYLLARDHNGAQYSADIAMTSPDTVHVLYGSGTGGGALDDNRTNRAVTYVRSNDGGDSWSNPVDIFTFSSPASGASNIRLLAAPSGPLYATWTEWDQSGNGQAIYFTRSLDDGRTWDEPTVLDRRTGDEYERDWTNLEALGADRLIAMWEGGYRAYPQAQYSQDGGQSWSKPIDTFYWLIADNGPAQFVRDSANRLHIFLMRRIREGFDDRCNIFPNCPQDGDTNGIWHSIWDGDTRWREPSPVLFTGHNYVSAALVGGNKVVMASFGYGDPDVHVFECSIEGVEPIAGRPWPTPTLAPTATPNPTVRQETIAAVGTPAPPSNALISPAPAPTGGGTSLPILLGVLPAAAVVLVAMLAGQLRR